MHSDIPVELLPAPAGAHGLSLSEHDAAQHRVSYVLQNVLHVSTRNLEFHSIDALYRPSNPY